MPKRDDDTEPVFFFQLPRELHAQLLDELPIACSVDFTPGAGECET